MRVLVACSVDPEVLQQLQAVHDVTGALNASEKELIEGISDADILIFRSGVSISRDVIAAASKLKLIIRAGSGLDNVDLEEVRRRGIELRRIPRPSAQAVAELTFAHMLALARNVRLADSLLREGHWSKHELDNYLLHGKTLGVVGAGNIGGRVGEMGAAWGMRVLGCIDPPSAEMSAELQARGVQVACFEDVVREADFLTVHVPLNEATRGLIDAEVLGWMKPGAFLVNMARGGVVDEAALHQALATGGLRGAGLDVHENEGPGALSPLRELPNVILTPHVGATTMDTQRAIGLEILEILDDFMGGRDDLEGADAVAGATTR